MYYTTGLGLFRVWTDIGWLIDCFVRIGTDEER